MCGSLGEVITIILAEGAGVMRHHNNQRNILAGLLTQASRLSLKRRRSLADTHLNQRSQRLARPGWRQHMARVRRPPMRTLPSNLSSLPSQLRPRSNILRPLRQARPRPRLLRRRASLSKLTPPPQASLLSRPLPKRPLEWLRE